MSEITQKTIFDLLENNYFIPSYQRGYRWGKRQIFDLLDDLCKFINYNNNSDSFYCLQPIVVKKCDDETLKNNSLPDDGYCWFEVIDGQQRLTTIYLILKYLTGKQFFEESGVRLFKIKYQTHENDDSFIDKPEEFNDSSPNAYFVTKGYEYIDEWFKKNCGKNLWQLKDNFRSLLLASKSMGDSLSKFGTVQVIWYETEEADPIKTFTRLNIGKIPLNNAELIKALFLQKREESDFSKYLQIQIAHEWDQIEYKLQDSNFWAFLNKGIPDKPTHIEFIFNTMFEEEKAKDEEQFKEKYGTDEYASFRFFSEQFEKIDSEKIKEKWALVDEYFQTFLEWYNNSIWYHYIGFLIYCDKSNNNETIIDLYKQYRSVTKKEFKNKLIEKIKNHFNLKVVDYGNGVQEIINKNGERISYNNSSKETLRQLLLLYNIEYILQKNEGSKSDDDNDDKNDYKRDDDKSVDKGFVIFPFDLFKKEKWDIEHIDSFTTNPLKDKEQQNEWIDVNLEDYKFFNPNVKIDKDKQDKIDEFKRNKDASKFDEIRQIISEIVGEEVENDDDIKNSLGNLTLLNADINRSYGNAIFPSKKKQIIEKDATGKFIPLCTKNVFLKNFNKSSITSIAWKKEDMREYYNSIISVIGKFLAKDEKDG